jgi:hypothetical protein
MTYRDCCGSPAESTRMWCRLTAEGLNLKVSQAHQMMIVMTSKPSLSFSPYLSLVANPLVFLFVSILLCPSPSSPPSLREASSLFPSPPHLSLSLSLSPSLPLLPLPPWASLPLARRIYLSIDLVSCLSLSVSSSLPLRLNIFSLSSAGGQKRALEGFPCSVRARRAC